MVSTAKLRRSQENTEKARPYAEKTRELVMEMGQGMSPEDHPFFAASDESARIGAIIVTSDKGLCGSFNNNIIFRAVKDLDKLKKQGAESVQIITVGKKAKDFFAKRNYDVAQSYQEETRTWHEVAVEIAGIAKERFLSGEWTEVRLYYTGFLRVGKYDLVDETLLPIPTMEKEGGGEGKNYIFEPSQKEILGRLLPTFLEVQIFKALLESETSEQASRMTAMDTASNNCKDLITDLTLVYNKARQATITKELLDIVGGAEALKK